MDMASGCRTGVEAGICFLRMTRCLYRLAQHYCEDCKLTCGMQQISDPEPQGRLFLALEGGYNPDLIAQ